MTARPPSFVPPYFFESRAGRVTLWNRGELTRIDISNGHEDMTLADVIALRDALTVRIEKLEIGVVR